MENSVLLGQLIANESVTRFPRGEETIDREEAEVPAALAWRSTPMEPLFSPAGAPGLARGPCLTSHTSYPVSCRVLEHAGHNPGVQRAWPRIKALFVEGP